MTRAFDVRNANFSNLGTSENGNLYIEKVIHKTHIDVNEKGVKASAATKIEIAYGAYPIKNEVVLDRPFVYMIMDNETGLPIYRSSYESPVRRDIIIEEVDTGYRHKI